MTVRQLLLRYFIQLYGLTQRGLLLGVRTKTMIVLVLKRRETRLELLYALRFHVTLNRYIVMEAQ